MGSPPLNRVSCRPPLDRAVFSKHAGPEYAPEGLHTMSVFAQYVPYRFEAGSWETRRAEVRDLIVLSLARFCENVPDCIVDMEVMGPPDIEKKVGLTGRHIFQGESLPPL